MGSGAARRHPHSCAVRANLPPKNVPLIAFAKTRVHLAHLCGVRGVDCEPGQQAHCDKRNSNHIAQFRHLPSPLGFQGRLIRRAPLTSGDPFMSRKTVEKWVKSLRDTRERLISPHARGPIGIEARNRLVAGPSIDGSARRVSSPEQR
jgi:hypothetical protein